LSDLVNDEKTTDRHHVQTVHLGTVLTILRITSGLSQIRLAEVSGVRATTISDYECGKFTPGTKTLKRLLDSLGLPWAALDLTQGYLQGLEVSAKKPFRATASLSCLELAFDAEAQREETEQILVLADKLFSRLLRLLFVPMFQGTVRLTRQQLLDILGVEERDA
jgi:transcriptional regulator with XRE-family HTH domain